MSMKKTSSEARAERLAATKRLVEPSPSEVKPVRVTIQLKRDKRRAHPAVELSPVKA